MNIKHRGTLIVRETAYITCQLGNFTKGLKGVKVTVVLRRKNKQKKLGLDAYKEKEAKLSVIGKCLCGSIEVTVQSEPSDIIVCHCTSCQKATGGTASYNIIVPDSESEISKGTTKVFKEIADSGSNLERHFCDGCGSPIYSATESYKGLKIFKAALFSDVKEMKVVTSIWCDSAPNWACIDDSVPSFAKGKT